MSLLSLLKIASLLANGRNAVDAARPRKPRSRADHFVGQRLQRPSKELWNRAELENFYRLPSTCNPTMSWDRDLFPFPHSTRSKEKKKKRKISACVMKSESFFFRSLCVQSRAETFNTPDNLKPSVTSWRDLRCPAVKSHTAAGTHQSCCVTLGELSPSSRVNSLRKAEF